MKRVLILSMCWLTTGVAQAVPYGYGDGPGHNVPVTHPIDLDGALEGFLNYGASFEQTDNIARATKGNERSASGLGYQLGAGLRTGSDKNTYWIGVGGAGKSFDKASQADYFDSDVLGSAQINKNGRHRLLLEGGMRLGHDPIGEDRLAGVNQINIDRWLDTTARVAYHFGLPLARMGLDIYVESLDREYQNNRSATSVLDFDRVDVGAVLSAAYSEKTQFVVGAQAGEVDYDDATSSANRDADEFRYFVGMRWLAAAKTNAEVRIGQLERDLASNNASDSSFFWDALVDWRPRSYSMFRLSTSVQNGESAFTSASFVGRQTTTLSWFHSWNEQWDTNVFLRHRVSDYYNSAMVATRSDDTTQLGASLIYHISSQASLRPRIDYAVNNSDQPAFEYERLDLGLSLHVGF